MRRRVAVKMAVLALVFTGIVTCLATPAKQDKPLPEAATVSEQTPERSAPAEAVSEEASRDLATRYNVPLDADLQEHIVRTCEWYHIEPAIVMAMAYRESGFNAEAIGDGGESYGLLQVQPKWHYPRMQALGCPNLLDPFQNVTVAVDYLAECLARYDGDMAKALVAYNQGHFNGTVTDYALAVLAMAAELRA